MQRAIRLAASLTIATAACSAPSIDTAVPELPLTSPEAITELLARSVQPVVINVWASWCIPCRAEAPLLNKAVSQFGEIVHFIGINVRDNQSSAQEFIEELLAETNIDHFFDRYGAVPLALGGSPGIPLTFFYRPGGSLIKLHFGVLDERTLALQIDELLARS